MADLTPSYSNPFQMDMLMLEPVHEMMHKGILIDQAEKKKLQDQMIGEWEENQSKLDWVVSLENEKTFNVGSTKWVPYYLYTELGLPVRMKDKKPTTNDAALRSLLAECTYKAKTMKQEAARKRWVEGAIACRLILNIRSKRKRISSFLGLKIKAGVLDGPVPFEDEDGRIRGTVSVGGTETARFSHSQTLWGTGINLATVPRKLRSMFVPDSGFEFTEFDLNRGESWIYAHLSEDPELLRIHTDGLDFHSETAAVISSIYEDEPRSLEWIIEYKEGEGYKIRYIGKKTNHACAYRMKEHTGAESINKESDDTGITVTPSEFRKARSKWLVKYFMIESWWNEIEAQLNADRTMRTPYGREHVFHDRLGSQVFKAATAYVPQSTSVDYLNRGWLRVHHNFQLKGAWDMSVLAQTHDSILVMHREGTRDEIVPEISRMLESELTIKGRTFTIPVEGSSGPNWGDLHG